MTDETPNTLHGRLQEGAHLAAYSAERALGNFKDLLEGEKWRELDGAFKNVNDFLESIQGAFTGFKLLADERKEIVKLIQAQQPEAQNTKIAGVLGVSEFTVRKDRDNSINIDSQEPELAQGGLPGPIIIEPSGGEAAKIVAETVEKQKKKEDHKAGLAAQIAAIEAGEVELPEGVFEVIVIDPPWPYGTPYDPAGRRAANPYPEISIEELKVLQLPASADCVLWLWTTHKFMRSAFVLLDAWGFQDKAIVTWVKNKMGLGQWLRSQSEFCVMAVRGKPLINLTNQTTVINGPMREHSRKPDEFYEMVKELCPGRRIDYFSREHRDGFESYGNEADKFS